MAITQAEIESWLSSWCVKAHKVTYRLKQQNFDPAQTYTKYFKKLMDYYDESDEYYKIQLVFKELFQLREECAELLDISKDELLSNTGILILSRQQPVTIARFTEVIKQYQVLGHKLHLDELANIIV